MSKLSCSHLPYPFLIPILNHHHKHKRQYHKKSFFTIITYLDVTPLGLPSLFNTCFYSTSFNTGINIRLKIIDWWPQKTGVEPCGLLSRKKDILHDQLFRYECFFCYYICLDIRYFALLHFSDVTFIEICFV